MNPFQRWPVEPTAAVRHATRTGAALALGAMLAGCGISGSSGATAVAAATAADLANPVEVRSVGGTASVALTAVVDPVTGGPAVSYAGALVMPTIRVSPGDAIDVAYTDALPAGSAEPLGATSLHFHGLSTAPDAPGDDSIDTVALPGQTLHYHVVVPATQPPGLYWYHPHAHGEADWQVSNGMSGAIVVEGTAAYAPETAGLPERVVILRNVLARPDFSSLARRRRVLAVRREDGGAPATAAPAAPDTICAQPFDIAGEYVTVNGRRAGVPIAMQPGKRQLWRVLNASSNGFYDLKLDGQRLHVVAVDGVPLARYPGGAARDVDDYVVPPAGRVEFTVAGPAAPGAAFHSSCTDTGAGGDPNPPAVLGLTQLGAPAGAGVVAAASLTPSARGTYDLPVAGLASEHRTVAFSEDDAGFYLNGRAYAVSDPPMFTVRSGSVEEWTLTNASTEVHAFHIHQVHFVTEDVDGAQRPAQWSDTVMLPVVHADGTPSVTHVLIDFRDPTVRGTFLFHCHLLEHEDGGMMAKVRVE